MKRFEGRNAIVTGASRGIGAAISERLAAEGANLMLVARTLESRDDLPGSLLETQETCARYGGRVEILTADLADPESRSAIVPAALESLDGRVDVLVNNAAAAMYSLNLDYPRKRRMLSFEVNFHAPFELMQAVLPNMIERREGWIVNLSSASAHLVPGPPFDVEPTARVIGLYGASKAALNRITNSFGLEFHDRGIRINTVEPRAAVLSEGADALVGDVLRDDQIESMEGMVEAAVALCDCEADCTAQIFESLQLLEDRGCTVMTLDGSKAYEPG